MLHPLDQAYYALYNRLLRPWYWNHWRLNRFRFLLESSFRRHGMSMALLRAGLNRLTGSLQGTPSNCVSFDTPNRHPDDTINELPAEGLIHEATVSIIVPTRDKPELLWALMASIGLKTHHSHIETIIIDNGSRLTRTALLLKYLGRNENIRVIPDHRDFNYAAINNSAVQLAKGAFVVFLNNDTEIITQGWLRILLGHAIRDNVGAVGALLLYPDLSIQHAGISFTPKGEAIHRFRGQSLAAIESELAQSVEAVTGACLMVKRSRFLEVNGMDTDFPVAYNDVDLCLKLNAHGYRTIFDPSVRLFHMECATRGFAESNEDTRRFLARWGTVLATTPCPQIQNEVHDDT